MIYMYKSKRGNSTGDIGPKGPKGRKGEKGDSPPTPSPPQGNTKRINCSYWEYNQLIEWAYIICICILAFSFNSI